MKKFIPTLLLGMITFFYTHGQDARNVSREENQRNTGNTHLDLMVNMVSTHLNYGDVNNELKDFKKPARGIQAGVSFQAGISSSFSLVTELYYVRKGGKLKDHNPLTGGEASLRLQTVELPVLARWHVGHFYVNAGPSMAYQISGSMKSNEKSDRISFTKSLGGFRRMDASVHMGGGLEFPLKQRRIALDIRYVYGLTDITYAGEMHNRALMISVHYSRPWKSNPFGKR